MTFPPQKKPAGSRLMMPSPGHRGAVAALRGAVLFWGRSGCDAGTDPEGRERPAAPRFSPCWGIDHAASGCRAADVLSRR